MVHLIKTARGIIILAVAAILVLSLPSYTAFVCEASPDFTVPCTIKTYGNAWNGVLAFSLTNEKNGTVNYPSYLVVMTTTGDLVSLRESNGYNALYNIANNTLLFQGEPYVDGPPTAPTYATGIWNLATGVVQNFPNVVSHHDIQYNPTNNTFLTLQNYVRTVRNNGILYDQIVLENASGATLWSWDSYNYIPLTQASPFNETINVGNETVIDFTHANSLDWDYNNGIIYLNSRYTNTFYKINQTTGNIIWACGQFGNFTLLDSNGKPVSSLWYGSHDVKEVAPDVFTIFNNDYGNITNPDDCHSSLIELTLNEKNMTGYVSRSWVAPKSYWTMFGGATLILPNGDLLGDFGDPTHQTLQNQPWDFNDTGAVFVEVNTAGQIVRTFTFPVGYYVYRVEPITNASLPLPTPNPSIPEFSLPLILGFLIATIVVLALINKRTLLALKNTWLLFRGSIVLLKAVV